MNADRPHYVYRHYDADDQLLYVGMTANPKRRPYERKGRPFLADSVRCDVTGPMPRLDAMAAERAAIVHEKPLHNQHRNNGNVTALRRAADEWWANLTPEEWDAAQRWMAEVASRNLRGLAS